jgi:hypothetical protein
MRFIAQYVASVLLVWVMFLAIFAAAPSKAERARIIKRFKNPRAALGLFGATCALGIFVFAVGTIFGAVGQMLTFAVTGSLQ